MYLIIEGSHALIIDPHYSSLFDNFLSTKKIDDVTILLTHEHPDHTSGVSWMEENFKVTLICQRECSVKISRESNNRPILISFILAEKDKTNGTDKSSLIKNYFKPYQCFADIIFDDEFDFIWENHKLFFNHTPGHSRGSCTINLDGLCLFTGDSLLKDSPTITKFPGGSTKDFINITKPLLKSFNPELIVLPGHGEFFKLSESQEIYKGGMG